LEEEGVPMLGRKSTFSWRHLFSAAASAWLLLCLPLAASAQGSGPPRGTEWLLWIFLAFAALFVLVLSTVLYWAGKRALFKGHEASRIEKTILFVMSILASCAAGVVLMVVFDLR
jgi:hypothetical protein